MSSLSYNESISICAQQENPFVANKPYNPDQVFGWVVDYLLEGESPLTTEEIEHAKTVYISALETLLGQDLAVTEANIIQYKNEILGIARSITDEPATVSSPAPAKSPAPAVDDYFECQGIRIPKMWAKAATVLILILILVKILK
jgi:hypothetical protein